MSLIKTGWTYKFKFIKKFEVLDGIYTIVKIYSYDELIKDRVSLFDALYDPLKIPLEEFNEDILNYRTQDIYKLRSPEGEENILEIFIPEEGLSHVPIYPVKRYANLVLYLPLGTYEEEHGLDYITNQVTDEIQGALGIEYEPKLAAISYTYLTEPEYTQKNIERDQKAKSILNFFTEVVRQRVDIDKLKAQNEALHAIIKSRQE